LEARVFHLYKEEERGLSGHTKAALAAPPLSPNPSAPTSSTSLLHDDDEALQEISTTTVTTPSCFRYSEEDLLLACLLKSTSIIIKNKNTLACDHIIIS
jgi:hypothetical protein